MLKNCHKFDFSTEMDEIWNSWNVKPPPACTVKTVVFHKEMRNLMELVLETSTTLSNFRCLNREAAILSRLLYKYKRMFRHDKAFQNLSKIHQCLKRFLKLDLSGTVETFRISLCKGVKPGASHAYLPTRQMLKWLLLRLLAFSQIFARVINLSKRTGTHLYMKLHLGWQKSLCLVVYSLTARILTASKFLAVKSIEWYNSLYGYLPYLEETAEFLPGFTFPDNLKPWLEDVDISPLKKKTSIDEVFEAIQLVEDEDGVRIARENVFKSFMVRMRADSDFEEEPSEERDQVQTVVAEDLGVPVREEEEESNTKKKEKKKGMRKLLKKQKKQEEATGRKRKKNRKWWK